MTAPAVVATSQPRLVLWSPPRSPWAVVVRAAPRQPRPRAASAPTRSKSGVVDARIDSSLVPRGGGQAYTTRISLIGPFESLARDLPSFDLAVSMDQSGAEPVDFEMIATGNAGYIQFQGHAYQIDPTVFTRIGAAEPFAGLDPTRWLANPSNEGHEEIDGTETIHTSGQAKVERIFPDLERAAKQIGLKPGNLEVHQGFFDRPTLDLFKGADDGILRRLELRLVQHGHSEDTGPSTATFEASITVSDVNTDQEIEAPEDAAPFSEVLPELPFQLSGLGEFLSAGATSGGL